MQMVKPEDMWSDYTCKKCAKELGLSESYDRVFSNL